MNNRSSKRNVGINDTVYTKKAVRRRGKKKQTKKTVRIILEKNVAVDHNTATIGPRVCNTSITLFLSDCFSASFGVRIPSGSPHSRAEQPHID